DQIIAIDWNCYSPKTASRKQLLKEYLHRSALWRKFLNKAGGPFFDLAAELAPDVRAPFSQIDRLVENGDFKHQDLIVQQTCLWSIHYREIQARGIQTPPLPDMFDPLIIMYERGGGISLDK